MSRRQPPHGAVGLAPTFLPERRWEDDAFAGDPPLCPIHRFAMIRRAGRLGVGWSCPVKGDDGS